MRVRSLGLRSELALAATRGRVLDRDGYLVVVTPDDPSYYDGNLLVLPAAPQVGEVAYWTRRFADELGHDPAIRHVALRWDGVTGDAGATDELTAAGFGIERTQVMTARDVDAPPVEVELRPLAPAELHLAAELEYALGEHHDERFRQFLHRRATWKRALVADGRATCWGAFDHGILVASLGIVPLGGYARYQDVQTALTHRRRGIARALLAAAARAVRADGVQDLVIVAEPGSAAARLYERVGFRTIEHNASARRVPAR